MPHTSVTESDLALILPDSAVPAAAHPPGPAQSSRAAAGPELQVIPGPDDLSPQQREILTFERQWWKHAGAKEQAVRELFGLSPTRYYQVLNELIDQPAALTCEPILVKRLRRLRATRQRNRAAARPNHSSTGANP
jgi:Protein of unknown function (DUF3263)